MPLSIVTNPILRGFNPDPSIIRVDQDFYIATSTFEWFPGVQIHHSTDLVNWNLIARPLNRLDQLDMRGVPDSGGVWAPCISYCDGIYYLVYSNVRSFQGVWKDTPNYIVTTDNILGDWTDPIFLSSVGFDGSLFHDSDGRKWFLSMIVDHRNGKFFGGVVIQEYDSEQQRLVGREQLIFEGSDLGLTEGPHIYQKDDWYYLITAEGGTEYNHAVTIARSKDLLGPYELHPEKHILTARNHPKAGLQKTGHGDFVFTEDGSCYLVCLASRPLSERGRCTLGRETILCPILWKEDDWPYLSSDDIVAPTNFEIESIQEAVNRPYSESSFITEEGLNINFQSLRIPMSPDWIKLDVDNQVLRLYGRESLSSLHEQSLIARRVQSFHIRAKTSIDFNPDSFQHLAGLVCYYNTYHWYYLHISCDDCGNRVLQITSCNKYQVTEVIESPIELPGVGIVNLMVDFNRADIQFKYSLDGQVWQKAGSVLDGSILSDDYVQDAGLRYRPAFTGSFVGVACQDLRGFKHYADFHSWEYIEIEKVSI